MRLNVPFSSLLDADNGADAACASDDCVAVDEVSNLNRGVDAEVNELLDGVNSSNGSDGEHSHCRSADDAVAIVDGALSDALQRELTIRSIKSRRRPQINDPSDRGNTARRDHLDRCVPCCRDIELISSHTFLMCFC